ncbi:TonB family protein [bacterium]|nr:TonB family protein [bacterium]
MSILGNFNDNRTEEKRIMAEGYKIPSIIANKDEDLPLKKSVVLSTVIHFVTAGTTWLIAFLMMILGITQLLFPKPPVKKQDIEFVLVDREATPLNKNTKYRADRNSRTGGINDPKKPVSLPSASQGKPSVSQPASQSVSKKPATSPAPKNNNIFKQITSAVTPTKKPAESSQSAGPKKAQEAKPQPPTARPSVKPTFTPKTVSAPTSNFKVPVPSGGTGSGKYVSGPISGSGSSANGGGNGGTSSGGSAGPKLAPTGSGSGTGSRLASGGGGGTGYGGGNPGGGGGRPGIDAIREPDFGPYMRDLQRRIKMNWDPPKGDESKRVVLLFKIAKDGRLLSCSVFKSSGLQSADKAALHAVQLTAPFKPLPAAYKGNSIDIQFTFDYNVFGAAGYQ